MNKEIIVLESGKHGKENQDKVRGGSMNTRVGEQEAAQNTGVRGNFIDKK